ncbi:MAG: putative metal-binding motif-containing protein [Bradymonadaceae bacterium]
MEDTGPVVPDVIEDTSEPDVSVPDVNIDPGTPTSSDFIICSDDLDCPLNGSGCVIYVPMNRTDADGSDEVALSDVFDELGPGEGVCSRSCSNDPTRCEEVVWPDGRGGLEGSSCIVVATGTVPYVLHSLDPFEVTVDIAEMEAGQAFAALCMPAFGHAPGHSPDFCASCDAPAGCSSESVCYNFLTGAPTETGELGQSACLQLCDDGADCPMGFSCDQVDEGSSLCIPASGTCTSCIDHDENGQGTGHCGPASARQTPFDCDDTNPLIKYSGDPFPAHCGAHDYNCDGIEDDLQLIGSANWGGQHCTFCGDTCEGEAEGGVLACVVENEEPACVITCPEGWTVCGTDPRDGCPISLGDSDYHYFEDKDDDGFGAGEPQFFCDLEAAEAAIANPIPYDGHPRDEAQNVLLDCDDDDPATYPGAPNPCNGKDNSCSGFANDAPNAADVDGVGVDCTIDRTGIHGTCREGRTVCQEDGGDWGLYCEQVVFAQSEVCDGLDNSCSGTVDDVPEIGDTCGTGLHGVCSTGERRCVLPGNQAPGDAVALTCAQTVFPTREAPGFDGIDHSCDGFDRYANSAGKPVGVVVPAGNPSTIQAALDSANGCSHTFTGQGGTQITVPCDVYLMAGDHRVQSTVVLRNGVSIYGGMPTGFQNWSVGDTFNPPNYNTPGVAPGSTVILASPETGAVRGVAGVNLTNPTRIYGVAITTGEVQVSCQSNVAMSCTNCPGLRLKTFRATAGAAGHAWPAGTAYNGAHGANGVDGDGKESPAGTLASFWIAGGASAVGNNGGRASESGVATQLGTDGIGPRGGPRGTDGDANRNGHPGGGGFATAQEPSNNPAYGTLDLYSRSFACERNWPGTRNVGASQGSGGGGSYTRTNASSVWGASGGGGGEGGNFGLGGYSGAPSIGLVLANSNIVASGTPDDTGPTFDNVVIQGGQGGNATDGGQGGDGGTGGARGSHEAHGWLIVGGPGGHGAGGNGGFGGHGGMSIGVLLHNSALNNTAGTTFNAGSSGSSGSAGGGGSGVSSGNVHTHSPDGHPGLNHPARACNVFDTGAGAGTTGIEMTIHQSCSQ